MTARVALVASSSSDVDGSLLTARLRHLVAAGWDARLLARGERWRTDPALRAPAVLDRVELAARPERRLRRLRPHLVHFHSGSTAWRAAERGRAGGSRVVIGFRDDGADLAAPDPERLWTWADRLVFPHEAVLERALALGYPRAKSELLPAPPLAPNGRLPRESPPATLRILSAGPLIWEQGYEHSIHAIRLLLDSGVRCEYRILGEGDHVQAVAFARHQLGLHDQVSLLTRDGGDPLADELRRADVFLDPAVTDTTSTSALVSAQAHGIPFVATARRAELCEQAGIVVPRRDPRAIAEALAVLARDVALRERLGGEARRAAAGASAAEHLAGLEALYRRTLDANGR